NVLCRSLYKKSAHQTQTKARHFHRSVHSTPPRRSYAESLFESLKTNGGEFANSIRAFSLSGRPGTRSGGRYAAEARQDDRCASLSPDKVQRATRAMHAVTA